MYLLYLDESGDPTEKSSENFVLGGVAVYENQAYYLSRAFDEIQDKWFPEAEEAVEFHASQIMNRHCEPWKRLGRENCLKLLGELCSAISTTSEKGITLFGVVVHKSSFPEDNPVEKAFHEICGHFDSYIDKMNTKYEAERRNRGLLVLDSARYRGHLDKLLLEYRKKGGTKFGRVRNFADAPTFADSRSTRLLQAADLVAYSIYRRYESGDARLIDSLIRFFQQSEGKLHGLVHMVSRYRDCCCPACISRRR